MQKAIRGRRDHVAQCQSTRAPYATEHNAFRSWGSNLSPDASANQRIISNNSYAHDEQGDDPGQENECSTVSSINCDRCQHLD